MAGEEGPEGATEARRSRSPGPARCHPAQRRRRISCICTCQKAIVVLRVTERIS